MARQVAQVDILSLKKTISTNNARKHVGISHITRGLAIKLYSNDPIYTADHLVC